MKEILEFIPSDKVPEQLEAFRLFVHRREEDVPLYKFLREPTHLHDVDWENYGNLCIWRDNETVVCVGSRLYGQYEERNVAFAISRSGEAPKNLFFTVYGRDNKAIAETATLFCSLKRVVEKNEEFYSLIIANGQNFDCEAFQPQQLAQILDANPTQEVNLVGLIFNEKQSIKLATRPFPLKLKLTDDLERRLAFKDGGTAFIDAIQERQSPFGNLKFSCYGRTLPLNSHALARLTRLEDKFESLKLSQVAADCALLPLSAKVQSLDYFIDFRNVQTGSFDQLDIAAKDLAVCIHSLGPNGDSTDRLISFLDRVAELGHFEQLKFAFGDTRFLKLTPITEALIRVMKANKNLTHIDLGGVQYLFEEAPHLENIFQALEENTGLLRTICVQYPPEYVRPDDYSALEWLLLRNQNIEVVNSQGKRITNGSSIEKLYALHDFYRGSSSLVKDSDSLRSSLVVTTLTESSLANFQYTALLLADHADKLCELLDGFTLESVDDAGQAVEELASPVAAPSD
ncbi:hypothetical protein FisN_10Lu417 [Fistulifera solaris]|uniref:Uncharacterized protein n=1 Tax=Fistulifera solaris TaxID=1519565 RepID=A0A1Z5JV96_FISSO|nr:hypothetical protein FisN_10Lu417 [Fistulifera solaris]|eukprot:GAX17698.1 hypothetical protein FisN_10Lu417 [Fistulifera solaris]